MGDVEATDQQNTILEARGVTKRFSGVLALDDASFQLRRGEVHALVGENGAGKSTLIKVLTGVHHPNEGQVLLDDEAVSFSSPRESQAAGISTIYQEVNLIPLRSVAQNVFLAREPRTRFGLLDVDRMNREAEEILQRYDIEVDVTAPLRSLGLGTQQMVAIGRAVSREASVVIMDEPTSSLETSEVQTLFRVIRQLKDEGVGVVYVSHQLDEIYEICDRVTVLRDGKVVHTSEVSEITKLELIAAMLGRDLTEAERGTTSFGEEHDVADEPVLKVRGLAQRHLLDDVSLDVRPGEIVGLGGLLGAGRSETVRAIFGADPPESGTVEVADKELKLGSPASAIKAGIAFLPEDRKTDGIIPGLSVRDNITTAALSRVSRGGLVSEKAQNDLVEKYMDQLGIKASSPDQPVSELSGGNQQKVLLARCLCIDPKVLLLDEPTRGIDVGAKAEVQQLIDGLTEEGLGVVLISSEMEEVVEGADRVVVLKDGTVVGTLSGDDLTEQELMSVMAGDRSSEGKEEAGE